MRKIACLSLVGVLLFVGCERKPKESNVVSQKYIHKYGYAVAKDEFETRQYPGQVITMMKNGVTVTATYENGVLHGPCTHTFPNSQTVESYFLYNHGELAKEILYDVTGMPIREEVSLSPTRRSVTAWYVDGTPMLLEEYAGAEILEGQYFSMNNDLEAQVVKGRGNRVQRDTKGALTAKEIVEAGYVTRRETFFPSGTPETIAYYRHGELNGEMQTFTASGEPLALKEFVRGKLHGKSTFFKNGAKHVEVHYLDGQRNGLEIHYLDGDIISQEIPWENDRRHGPAKYYFDGMAKIDYYYDGQVVSETEWKDLNRIDAMISRIDPSVQIP
jgi:antitoxin component YwqK of YwqJK toxin-antitoxin module